MTRTTRLIARAAVGVLVLLAGGLTAASAQPPQAIARLASDDGLRMALGTRGRGLVERQHDERLTAAALLAKIRAADAEPGRAKATVGASPSLAATDRRW